MKAGKVQSVTINGMEVNGAYKDDNGGLHVLIPANYPTCTRCCTITGVNIDIKETSSGTWVRC